MSSGNVSVIIKFMYPVETFFGSLSYMCVSENTGMVQ